MSSPPNPRSLICTLLLLCSTTSMASVHDLLPIYNLPKGLLPKENDSCCLSNADNSFTMRLAASPCYVRFNDQVVYFDRIVKGKLGFGEVRGVSGIRAKKFFLWVDVSGIDVDEENGMLEFHVGAFSQKFPRKDFESIHGCMGKVELQQRQLQPPFSVMETALM